MSVEQQLDEANTRIHGLTIHGQQPFVRYAPISATYWVSLRGDFTGGLRLSFLGGKAGWLAKWDNQTYTKASMLADLIIGHADAEDPVLASYDEVDQEGE